MKIAQAEMEARAETRRERYLAILDGWKSYGKGTTTCQTETSSCPEEMDATRLVYPEETEAAVERAGTH
jgi:polyphosphate kinase 2 (PPK2 family)